jgi:hypothetical protein
MRVSLSGHFVFKLDAGGARMPDDWLKSRFEQYSRKKADDEYAHRAALDSYDSFFDRAMARVEQDIGRFNATYGANGFEQLSFFRVSDGFTIKQGANLRVYVKRTYTGIMSINTEAGGMPMKCTALTIAYNAVTKHVQYKDREAWLEDESDASAIILGPFCPTAP